MHMREVQGTQPSMHGIEAQGTPPSMHMIEVWYGHDLWRQDGLKEVQLKSQSMAQSVACNALKT